MYISPVSNNFYKPSYVNRNSVSRPNFKGTLNDIEMKRNLGKLRVTLAGVVKCEDEKGLKEVMDKMHEKFMHWNVDSIGLMVVPQKDLVSFSCGQVSPEDASKYVGVCVAVGDQKGPVESWTVSYESKLVLLPKSCFEKK